MSVKLRITSSIVAVCALLLLLLLLLPYTPPPLTSQLAAPAWQPRDLDP